MSVLALSQTNMPTFIKMIAAAAMVAAAQGAPVLDANDALDARMAQLEAKVKALEFGAKVKALQEEWGDDGDDDGTFVKEKMFDRRPPELFCPDHPYSWICKAVKRTCTANPSDKRCANIKVTVRHGQPRPFPEPSCITPFKC